MVKYEYRPELEVFRRVDNRGPSLKFNIVEARRIKSMMDLGIKAPSIYKKIDFVNDVSMTNLRTFMNNIEDGNVKLEGDYPVPTEAIEDLDYSAKISALEDRMDGLEDKFAEIRGYCSDNAVTPKKSAFSKFKGWLRA